jgi:DinB superfamily
VSYGRPQSRTLVEMPLQNQLAGVVADFEAAQQRLHRLSATLPDARWAVRADPERWSVAECVAHLNLTSRAYVPLLRAALERARALRAVSGEATPVRYRRDPVGWLLWRTAGPPVRLARMRTTAPFVPEGDLPREEVIAEFDRLQAEQVACAREADGLPLDRVRITSPFNARLHYNLFACLTILPRHQHRHLWQAERVWSTARASAT